jgi:PKD repeat protein
MRESLKPFRSVARALFAAALAVSLACSTDSPTEPRQNPQPPGGQPSGTFTITLGLSTNQVSVGSPDPITVTVNVRQVSNNQPPPNGTTVELRTTLGDFNTRGSGQRTGIAELFNGTAQVLLFAGDSSGTAQVTARLQDSVAQASVSFVGSATFFLQAIAPTIGSPNGGETVRITGGGFREPARVTFGSFPAQVLSVTNDTIRVRTPAIDLPVGGTQRVGVTVTSGLNTEFEQSDTLANAFTYTRGGSANQPVIFSVTPNSGPNEGGTRVVIEGDGFESPVQVLFGTGGSPASFSGVEAVVESVTSTRIVAVSPSATGFGQNNQNAEVSILVRNRNSGDAAIFANGFRYGVPVLITAIQPNQGPYNGGTLVTLFGQGFDEPVAVSLAGFGQQIVSVTGTEIIVRTVAIDPGGCSDAAATGPSSVTNIETGDSATGPNFTYRVEAFAPRINGVAPDSGDGGEIVTISGSNFTSSVEVGFAVGGQELRGSIQSVTPSQITVRAPTPPPSVFDTQDCDDNGDGTTGERYIPTQGDVLVTDTRTTCEASFAGGFTFLPTDTSCRNDVGPVEPAAPPEALFSVQNIDPVEFTVQFVDESTGQISSWNWNFGDGSPPSGVQNPSHDYAAAGNYSVTLTVTGPGGSDSYVQVITVPVP